MGFLKDLTQAGLSALNEQYAPNGGAPSTFAAPDPDDPNRVLNFGQLGEFARQIDDSAQRSYVENGFIRNLRPRNLEFLMQQPDLTIVVRKRTFSSLVDSYRQDLMDQSDKLLVRATKELFQKKCQAISIYEKLTKVEEIVQNKGVLDEYMVPLITDGIESLDALTSQSLISPETRQTFQTLRKLQAFSNPEQTTTWNIFQETPYFNSLGEGTGTFDLTLAASVSTNVGTKLGSGSANLTLEDPYNLMYITQEDIDGAIQRAANQVNNTISNFTNFAFQELSELNAQLKEELLSLRVRRGASPITFKVNENTQNNKVVRAFIDFEGRELIYDYDPGVLGIGATVDLDVSATTGPNGLSATEQQVFSNIIVNTLQLINQEKQQSQTFATSNKESDLRYVREKMTLNYFGKTIIQPMDSVHIFMSSKTTPDERIIGYEQSSVNASDVISLLGSTVDNFENLANSAASLFGRNPQSIDTEKRAVVGDSFPTWLWNLLRNDFTKQSAGPQVFEGIVDTSSTNYSSDSGKYTVSVSLKDNSYYFELGRYNYQPSVDVVDNELYNPITPFDLDFDPANGFLAGGTPDLLRENSIKLKSGALKFNNGRYRGFPVFTDTYTAREEERSPGTGFVNTRQVFNDPYGFVYRWKSGIGTFIHQGQPDVVNLNQDRGVVTRNDPFAGQDAVNVMSLLITGQPYNYNTFVRASIESGGLNSDAITGDTAVEGFLRGLLSDLNRNNVVWGNFLPFKTQNIDQKGLAYAIRGQYDVIKKNSKINNLLSQRSRFFDSVIEGPNGAEFAENPNIYIRENISFTVQEGNEEGTRISQEAVDNIFQIDQEINSLISDTYKEIENSNISNGTLRIFGDDISFDPQYNTSGSSLTEEQVQQDFQEQQERVNNLSKKQLWKVKANDSLNYFIVDDQYDKNLDVMSFSKALQDSNIGNYASDYGTVREKLDNCATVTGLEIFVNTQGHVVVRPPGYNKVPSSVFTELLRTAQRTGKRVFPKALEGLFITNADGLFDRLETIEDNVRYRGAALGINSDSELETFISDDNQAAGPGNFFFRFISNENTGRVGATDFRALVEQAYPDVREDNESGDLRPNYVQGNSNGGDQGAQDDLKALTSEIDGQTATSRLFDINKKFTALSQPIEGQSIYNTSVFTSTAQLNRLNLIRDRLRQNKNAQVPPPSEFISNRAGETKQVQKLRLINEISRYVTERQGILLSLKNAMKNLNSALDLENDPNLRKKAILDPKTSIPSLINHMIEDESYDDLGRGSGERYIVQDRQIKSLTITESPPEFTAVQVEGLYAEGIAPPGTGQGFSLTDGGNIQNTAVAVDYDMWRSYGFRKSNTVNIPSLQNPETQLAPFAVYLLNRMRKNIFKGTLTIVGNEFMQPGEVVYIESKDLLFYVENVSHSFSYGGDFTTTLTLTYGHAPGAYIPTHLDIIGKTLYSKAHSSNLVRHSRNEPADGSKYITTLVIDDRGVDPDNENAVASLTPGQSIDALVGGSFGESNRRNMDKIIITLAGAFTPNNQRVPKIRLRTYFNSLGSVQTSPNRDLTDAANAVKDYIANPQKYDKQALDSENTGGIITSGTPANLNVSSDDITVEELDRVDGTSPSSGAWSAARDLTEGSGTIDARNTCDVAEDNVLLKRIIDVWVEFEDAPREPSTEVIKNGATSANEQLERAALADPLSSDFADFVGTGINGDA